MVATGSKQGPVVFSLSNFYPMAKKTNTLIIAAVGLAIAGAFYYMYKKRVTIENVDWLSGQATINVGGRLVTITAGQSKETANGLLVWDSGRITITDNQGRVKLLAEKI